MTSAVVGSGCSSTGIQTPALSCGLLPVPETPRDAPRPSGPSGGGGTPCDGRPQLAQSAPEHPQPFCLTPPCTRSLQGHPWMSQARAGACKPTLGLEFSEALLPRLMPPPSWKLTPSMESSRLAGSRTSLPHQTTRCSLTHRCTGQLQPRFSASRLFLPRKACWLSNFRGHIQSLLLSFPVSHLEGSSGGPRSPWGSATTQPGSGIPPKGKKPILKG